MTEQMLNLLIPNAFAASTASPQQGGGISFAIMFILFILVVYIAMWRPQNKRAKEQQNLLNSLAKGDEVITAGGLIGRISKITEQYVSLSVSSNVEILVQKTAVVNLLPKGTMKAIE